LKNKTALGFSTEFREFPRFPGIIGNSLDSQDFGKFFRFPGIWGIF